MSNAFYNKKKVRTEEEKEKKQKLSDDPVMRENEHVFNVLTGQADDYLEKKNKEKIQSISTSGDISTNNLVTITTDQEDQDHYLEQKIELRDLQTVKDLEEKFRQLTEKLTLLENKNKNTRVIPTYEKFLQYVKSKQASSSVCSFLYKRIEKNPRKQDRATVMKVLEVIREMNSE